MTANRAHIRGDHVDLIIRNARLPNRSVGEPLDLGVAGGKIVTIESGLADAAETYDAGGRLVCAGLIETHIHLDKARIIDRCPPEAAREISPMRQVAALKSSFTVEDVRARAEGTLVECILNGATRMRTQVEVDPAIGMRGFDAVQSLIADYRWAIDIEICVFPQDGLTNCPATDELLVEGLKRGVKVIGGAPRYDTDSAGQIRRIFDLAREYDVDIDLHLDVGNTPEAMHIRYVCELTEQHRRGGRVVVGRMAKLSMIPPDQLAVLARRLADVGIAVTVLPATDLYLNGARPGSQCPPRCRRRQFPRHARRQLLFLGQHRAQSGDTLRRLLADPNGEPLPQRPTGRRSGTAA